MNHTSIPCQSYDPDLWFAERASDLALAQELCGTCPLRLDCLDAAIQRAEPWGVWGGRILVNGAIIAVKRGRGRPRKVA